MELIVKHTKELTNHELLHILQVRVKVFVVEQNCAYQEVDGADFNAIHVMFKDGNDIVAYTRIIDHESYVSFGRVLVTQNYRKKYYGREIVQKTIDVIKAQYKQTLIKISGQAHLKSFYSSFGFICISEVYLEDNIPHIDMTLEVK